MQANNSYWGFAVHARLKTQETRTLVRLLSRSKLT